MKKFILSAILGLSLTGAANVASAQTFSVADTVRYIGSGAINIKSSITNTVGTPIKVSWKVIDHNLPTSWQDAVGICDNNNCYTSTILGNSTSTPPTAPYTPPGTSKLTDTFSALCDFHIQMDFSSLPAGGPYYVTVQLQDATTTKTTTFLIGKWASNVPAISQQSTINIYPNPVKDELNVYFDANAGVKNISIYNVIGKAISVHRVTGSNAMINMDNVPAGIYFARLTDAQGHVVATRKFIHQ